MSEQEGKQEDEANSDNIKDQTPTPSKPLSQKERLDRMEKVVGGLYEKLPAMLAEERKIILSQAEESDKKILDTLIASMAEGRNKQMQSRPLEGTNAPNGSTGSTGGFAIGDILGLVKQFGLLGDEGGFSEMEMGFAKMLQQGYYNYLKVQQKDFARKMGLPWHEVEGEH